MPTWLITGCSTGFGRELALAVLARGWNVVVTARNRRDIEDIGGDADSGRYLRLALDVTDRLQIETAIGEAETKFGGIDVLVNNAGYGYRTAVEEADEKAIRAQFETNFFGLVQVTKSALPSMRTRGRGTIINISSAAGRAVLPGSAFYSASKFAVEGFSDGLHKEIAPLGLRVMLVEPGPFRTDFGGRSLKQSPTPMPQYAATAGMRRKETGRPAGTEPGDPARAAQAIIAALEAKEPPFRLVLGRTASDRIEAELKGQLKELHDWRAQAIDADFPTSS
jgi:NAD(P)-dependent dehydrogenase (short-subunit alcohol dehydrogenase family)